MKKKRIRWVLLPVVVLLAVWGVKYLLREEPLHVEMALVDSRPMQVTVSAEGRTRVRDRFLVSSSVEGRLGRMDAKEGHPVKHGAILAWITPAPLEIRSEKQREAGLQVAVAEKQSADAEVQRARLALEQSTRELQRVTRLVEQGIRPSQELDTARTAEASAHQAVNAATFAATAASYHIEELRSSLLKTDAQAIAVRAPVEGVVLKVYQQSERVVASGVPIVEIGDPRHLEIVFETLSTDAVRIRPGADVIVQNWGGDETLAATIRTIEPGAYTKVSALGVEEQRVNVIAEFCGDPPLLGDGYRVEGEVVVWESPEAVQVPVSALFRAGADWNVFVVEGDRASLRVVKIGQRNQKDAQVLGGLSKGETVILYPDDRLAPGVLVSR